MIDVGMTPTMLKTQYRMHPVIAEYPSARYYDNQLENGVSADERDTPAGFLWPDWNAPVAFVPIDGAEELAVDGKSRVNRDEAGWVVRIVEQLLEAGDLQPSDIGVVSPYNGQVQLLTDLFDGKGILAGEGDEEARGLEIRSIDGYQGREKEVIVLSTVRANDDGEVGFLSDHRRLNVAITRPRRGLIVVGNPDTLRHDGDWEGWLEWVRDRKLEAWHVLQSY
jgi:regulator of nonsense transcripts 1